MNENNKELFHISNDNKECLVQEKTGDIENKNIIIKHITTHYQKYLVFGFLGGVIISLMGRITLDKNIINNQINANEDSPPEIIALNIFDQAMAFAHEKDLYFHQSGKIYSLEGDTLFKKYDTMFHILDNNYHQSIDINERLIRAKRCMDFIKMQDTLFTATEYIRTDKDSAFKKLDEQFSQALEKIETTIPKNITGGIENTTGDTKSMTSTGTKDDT